MSNRRYLFAAVVTAALLLAGGGPAGAGTTPGTAVAQGPTTTAPPPPAIAPSISVGTTTPLADEALTAVATGVAPGATASVQLCAGLSFLDPEQGPFFFPLTFPAGACRVLGTITADATGSGRTEVRLPATALALGGLCVPPGAGSSTSFGDPSSFSFSVPLPPEACNLVLTDDTTPADGTTQLALRRIFPGLGTGAISGTVRDSVTGAPVGPPFPGASALLTVCSGPPAPSCVAPFGRSEALVWNTDGTYAVRGLADGRYTVLATPSGATSNDFRTVEVNGGATTEGADLNVPITATSWSNSGGTARVEVTPTVDAPFDAPLVVRGTGFSAGEPVRVQICTLPIRFFGGFDGSATAQCESGGLPAGTVTPDGSGSFSLTIPFDEQRFTRQCIGYFADGPESSSFSLNSRCAVVASESTGEPSAAWTEVTFRRPAGAATIRGTVTVNGQPLPDASVFANGPTGTQSRTTTAEGGYEVGGLPDGTFQVTASLPFNYLLPFDPASLSFGTDNRSRTTTATVTGQADARADVAFEVAAGRVEGRVEATGGALQFASIQALGPDGTSGSVNARPDGTWFFAGLAPGRWTIRAQGIVGGSFATAERVVEVGTATVTGIELTLAGPPPAQISIGPDRPAGPTGWWTAPVTVGVVATSGALILPASLLVDGVDTGATSRTFDDGVFQVIGRSPGLTTDGFNPLTTDPLLIRVDTRDPEITVTAPAPGTKVTVGTPLTASFSCSDTGSGIATCGGTVPDGAPLDTSTPGERTLTVTATDVAGRSSTASATYTVTEPPRPTDRVRLDLSGARTGRWDGPLTGGDITVRTGPGGTVDSVTGSGTVAGLRGGNAAVTFSLQRVPFLRSTIGLIRISDPGAGLTVAAPYLGRPVVAADGTVSGVAVWRQARAGYRLEWSVLDGRRG